MDSELRTLLDHSTFHLGALREVGALLPASDEELSAVITETIASGDQMGFLLVITAALDAGRRVDASHLVKGTALANDPQRLGNLAWKMEGDVPGALMAALKLGGISTLMHAGALFVVAAWCVERRGGELPPEFAAESRQFVRRKNLPLDALRYIGVMTLKVRDEGFLAVVSQNYPRMLDDAIQPTTKNIADRFLAQFADPVTGFAHPTPPKTLAQGRPMRRAVEKISRNDLCHCGSGRKYKRCCFEKDQERLHFSSEVAGHTRAELREDPEAGLTEPRLKKLPPFELARIDPRKVPENLLRCYITHATGLMLWERAVEFFEVVEWDDQRKKEWLFVSFFLMRELRKDLIVRMVAARARHEPVDDLEHGFQLLIARDDPAEELRVLDAMADAILRETDAEALSRLGYGVLFSRHAALGILICRSLIPMLPLQEASSFLRDILTARDKLNLPPDDPFSDVHERRLAEHTPDEGADAVALRTARKRLDAKAAEVRQLNEEIDRQRRALERLEKKNGTAPVPAQSSSTDEAERSEMRIKLAELKVNLQERTAERTALRHDLEKTQKELETLRQTQSAPAHTSDATTEDEAAHYLPEQPAGNQPLRLVEFPHKFRETLEDFPRQAARAALAMIGRLAGGEPAAFVGVVPLKACPGIFRQRIGSEHRLLFRLLPDRVQIVDLINRRDLDRKIKSLQAAG